MLAQIDLEPKLTLAWGDGRLKLAQCGAKKSNDWNLKFRHGHLSKFFNGTREEKNQPSTQRGLNVDYFDW